MRFEIAKSHNRNGFSAHSMPEKTFRKSKIVMFGHSGRIYGTWDDDYNSCDTISNQMEQTKPRALILGDVSHTKMDWYQSGEIKYLKMP